MRGDSGLTKGGEGRARVLDEAEGKLKRLMG